MGHVLNVDALIAEIGSTTTLVNGFADLDTNPRFIGQGQAPTSVLEGDVRRGLEAARLDLAKNLGVNEVKSQLFLAASSAAGGLVMSVHGLVYDMTVKAAQAAALGAGAVIRQTTAGKLRDFEIEELLELKPQLILLAGGTDYGERETALYNAKVIAELNLGTPVIYAGNCQNAKAVQKLFQDSNSELYITENVYPKLDMLNVEPARKVIQQAFEKHIVKAPGMEHIRDLVNGEIMPTPGAVMQAAKILYEDIGDLAVVDIGGATTDVHSVTPGSDEIAAISIYPEPVAKRTVEGDLGVYVNRQKLLDMLNLEEVGRELNISVADVLNNYQPIPNTPEQCALTTLLAETAGLKALERHVGIRRNIYSAQGRRTIAEGKDLTAVKVLVATGGALTRLPQREEIMRHLADMNRSGKMLYPRPGKLDLAYDNHYVFASLGVLSLSHPEAARQLIHRSLHNESIG